MHISQRFEKLLDSYRRPDGSQWTGQQLDEATEGVVPRSYVTNLSKGRIESPGYEKMAAIVKAMGFPPGAWFEEGASDEPALDWGLAGALQDETIRDTVREMSRLSKPWKSLASCIRFLRSTRAKGDKVDLETETLGSLLVTLFVTLRR